MDGRGNIGSRKTQEVTVVQATDRGESFLDDVIIWDYQIQSSFIQTFTIGWYIVGTITTSVNKIKHSLSSGYL